MGNDSGDSPWEPLKTSPDDSPDRPGDADVKADVEENPRHEPRASLIIGSSRGPLRYLELDWRTVLTMLGVFTGFALAYSTVRALPSIFTTFVVAVFLSLALNPLVGFVERRARLQRGIAIALVLLIITFAIALLSLVFGPKTVEAAENLQEQLPNTLDQMTSLPIVGETLAENDVPAKVQQWLSDLPSRLGSDEGEIASFVASVTQGLGYFLLTCTLTIMLLLDGPLLARRSRQMIPVENQLQTSRLGKIVYEVVARYFAGSILLGVLFGLWVLITGLILNVPLTPLLAVWAGITALLPQIGGALGGIVVVAVSLTAPGGIATALIMGGLFVTYMTISNNLLLPVLVGRAINVTPPTTMLAAIAGFAVGGIVGALFAMPVVGAIKAVYLDVRAEQDRTEDEAEKGKKKRRLGLVVMVKRRRARRAAAAAATGPATVTEPERRGGEAHSD